MAENGTEMCPTHVFFSLVEPPFYENVPRSVKIFFKNFKNFLSIKSLAAEGPVAASRGRLQKPVAAVVSPAKVR